MSDTVMLVVLGAALLHALWNALVKGAADKTLGMVGVVVGHAPLAILALCVVEPPAASSLPWLVAGIALHVGYQLLLVRAYRFGDVSQIYPIARGSAPVIVTLVSVAFLGVLLTGLPLAAVFVIAAGVGSVCLVRQGATAGFGHFRTLSSCCQSRH